MNTFSKIFIFLLVSLNLTVAMAQIPQMGGVPPQSSMPTGLLGTVDSINQLQTRFFTDLSDHILAGWQDRIELIDISSNKVIGSALQGSGITCISVDPKNRNRAIVATDKGNVWWVTFIDSTLQTSLIQPLSQGEVGIIHSCLFRHDNPDFIIAAEWQRIHRSFDGGQTWLPENSTAVPGDQARFIHFLMQDPDNAGTYLVSASHESRYLGNWDTKDIVPIDDGTMPHGYMVLRRGIQFVPVGENDNYFSFKGMGLRFTDVVVHPAMENVFFGSGVGRSAVRIERQGKRLEVMYLNNRLTMTYSIDISRDNPDHLIMGTSRGIYFSTDGGLKWEKLE